MWHDLQWGARRLISQPGLTAVVVLTLGLGIGANGAVLNVVRAVVLGGLPYEEPDRLFAVEPTRSRDGSVEPWLLSYPNFVDLREASGAFAPLVAHTTKAFNVRAHGEPFHAVGELVSEDYFNLLGSQPVIGRGFSRQGQERRRSDLVVVVSHGLWRRYFGGSDSLRGAALDINDRSFAVIGVMSPEFHPLSEGVELWVPLAATATLTDEESLDLRHDFWLRSVGRLAPGATERQARSELETLAARLGREYPDENRGLGFRITPLWESWYGEVAVKLWGLLAASSAVLLLACANVASLLWTRTLGRRRELALRSALGASSGRLARQLMVESVLLALLGGCFAAALVQWVTGPLVASSSLDLRSFLDLRAGPAAVVAVLVLALSCSLLFGLLPALKGSRGDLREELKAGGAGAATAPRSRFLDALVVGEIALAAVLLYSAGAAQLQVHRLSQSDLGFRPERLMTARIDLAGPEYATNPRRLAVAARIFRQLKTSSKDESIALVGPYMPSDRDWLARRFTAEGWGGSPEDATSYLEVHQVSTGYFEMMGVQLRRGRVFQLSDAYSGVPVLVLSEAAAQRFFPGQDPLGRNLKLGDADAQAPWMRVIGIVDDVSENGYASGSGYPHAYIYIPQLPPFSPPTVNVLVRTAREPGEAMLSDFRKRVQALVPGLPVYDVESMSSRLEAQLASDRFLVRLMSLFTGIALVLAAAGVYGLLSYRMARRRRDLGIRLALGSTPAALFWRVIREGTTLALAGAGIGLALTIAAVRIVGSRLVGVSLEGTLLWAVPCVLVAVTFGAGLHSALATARLDPNTVLRKE
jgi:putative ABC transport system permease protein